MLFKEESLRIVDRQQLCWSDICVFVGLILVFLLVWMNSEFDSDDGGDMWRILTKIDQVKQSQVLDEFCLQFTLTSDTQMWLSLIKTTWVNPCSTLYCSVLSVFTVVDIFTAVLLDCSVNCEMMHLFSEARKT